MEGKTPRRRLKRWILRIGAVLVLLAVFFILLDVFLRPQAPPARPLPSPNGYDDLVRAGKMATRLENYEVASIEELRQFVAQNAEAFEVARLGLSRECRIPFQYTKDAMPVENMMALRRLGNLFEAEGMLAEKEGRFVDVVKSSSDLFRLGHRVVQGGCFIDFLVGATVQDIGILHLNRIAANLSAREFRESIDTLEKWAFDEKTVGDVDSVEMAFQERNYGLLERSWNRILTLLKGNSSHDLVEARADETRTATALLLASLALHAHKLERDGFPSSLSDLVPGYLKGVPIDPHSGKPLIYRLKPGGYVLYSAGPDGKDDSGQGDDVAAGAEG